jgi:predicted nucleic acid-binding protein
MLARVRVLALRYPLRAYDAVQLAAALLLSERGPSVQFWSADGALVRAARTEGLRALVPTD